jgi:hypothetical protein
MFDDIPRAIPDERGCGDRSPGGIYAESGLSKNGSPLEAFMFDPPLPLPPELDLVNKTLLWQRVDPATGENVLDEDECPIFDLLIHVGAEHYPWAVDYLEETRRLGASRKLNPHLDLSKLSRSSRMLLAHQRAIIPQWRTMIQPVRCGKHVPFHDQTYYNALFSEVIAAGEGIDATGDDERAGPCIFKLWEVIPSVDACNVFARDGDLPFCLRRIGSTTYHFQPTGEKVEQWEEGFILALPITGIALIQYDDGTVNQSAHEKLLSGIEQHGRLAMPFFATDK